MATEKAIVDEVNNSKLRLTPAVDYAQEKTIENNGFNYGGIKSYSDKIFDVVSAKMREFGDSIKDNYKKLQPAYTSSGCGYC